MFNVPSSSPALGAPQLNAILPFLRTDERQSYQDTREFETALNGLMATYDPRVRPNATKSKIMAVICSHQSCELILSTF